MSSIVENAIVKKVVKISKKDSKKSLKVEDSQETSMEDVKIPDGSIPVDEDVEEADEGVKNMTESGFIASYAESGFIASFAEMASSTQVQMSESIANVEEDEDLEKLLADRAELDRKIYLKEKRKLITENVETYRTVMLNMLGEEVFKYEEMLRQTKARMEAVQMEVAMVEEASYENLSEFINQSDDWRGKLKIDAVKKTAKKVASDSEDDSEVSVKKAKKSVAVKQRKQEWSEIADGTRLRMTYKGANLIYTKSAMGLVKEEDGSVYKSMNDAIRKYKTSVGDHTSFGSAWNYFKNE